MDATRRIPSYEGWHHQLRRMRGPASSHLCVRCGRKAMHWSYDYSDPDPLYGQAFLKEFPYSLDANRYRPMCRSCHKNHDNCRRPPALPPEYGEYEEHHKLYFNNAEHGDAPSADALGRLAHLLSVRQ